MGEGYTLLLDVGCFHTLPGDLREAYADSVSAVAAPGAALLLFGFGRPPRLAPMHAGLTADELRERFGRRGWELPSAERMPADAREVAGRRAGVQFEAWRCRLRRLGQLPSGPGPAPVRS